ncbi:WD40-repeat-containing domain protein [Syncephalis pseudoplumigaleata]|uniref:WD40-repeat-containing domain protein n=1 Tax=Syncephalis pseudoplumigaleata TaxID=1712513 RepID=A0A4V1J1U2_9FUNG|nr:WD40-repeat-containing domain protein [Syncephalis pseudoplumigaleata]|eukprot:RKP26249.1 WD40-repeat-containing domain protein [Syncephalis pseudoplumigaleata]
MRKSSISETDPATYTLPGVLHFLQQEWWRFERERNEWEIERAELKAILALEGQCRSQENVKVDLIRRVKMLEHAVRLERCLYRRHSREQNRWLEQPATKTTEGDTATSPSASANKNSSGSNMEQLSSFCTEQLAAVTSAVSAANAAALPLDDFIPKGNAASGELVGKAATTKVKSRSYAQHGGGPSAEETSPTLPPVDAPPTVRLPRIDIDLTVDSGTTTTTTTTTAHSHTSNNTCRPAKVLHRPPLTEAMLIMDGGSHLDTVRAIDFHQTELTLASGAEDGLVKIWSLPGTASGPARSVEYEPRATMRGHQGAVNAVQICTAQNKCFSAGADAAIMVWNMPSSQSELYLPHDAKVLRAQYIGHSDIIWDLRLQPASESNARPLIASAAADGTVKLWDTQEEGSPLRSSFSYEGAECGDSDLTRDINPISVDFNRRNHQQMVIGYGNGALRLFDAETGQLVMACSIPATCDGSPNTQINRIVAHPTASLVMAAYEDRYLRCFDLNTGRLARECTQTIQAHSEALSSVDIHPTGTTLVTGGHDGQVKLWDMRSLACQQEVTTHRRKLDEGVLHVCFHRTRSWLASGGADSVIKLFC